MRVNGHVDNITIDDLYAVGDRHDVPAYRRIVAEVAAAVREWPRYGTEAGLPEAEISRISEHHQQFRPN